MNQYIVAGGVLLVVGLILGLIGLIWWVVGRKRPAHIPGPVMMYLERINWAGEAHVLRTPDHFFGIQDRLVSGKHRVLATRH